MALEELTGLAGIPEQYLVIFIVLLIVVAIWEAVWKLTAMWKAAKNGSLVWFIVLAIFNTVGILPILYIFWFSKINFEQVEQRKDIKKLIKIKKPVKKKAR